MKRGRHHPNPPKHRRMFWRVYWHSFAMLFIVAISVSTVAALLRAGGPWDTQPAILGKYLSLRYTELKDNPPRLKKELELLYSMGRPLDATVFDIEGNVVSSNVEPPLPPLEVARVSELSDGALHNHSTWRSAHYITMPLSENGQIIAYVRTVFHPIKDHTFLKFVTVVLTLFGALALASIPLVRNIVAPLSKLTRAVNQFGEGELSTRLHSERQDEVGHLSRAFDNMADHIQTSIRSQKQLLANVSHELRTPLARIRVALELAEEGDGDTAKLYLGEVATDLKELERLVEDVLTAARLELAQETTGKGTQPLRKESTNLQEIVLESMGRFREHHPESTIELKKSQTLPSANVDGVLLRRVLDNLLENAWKYGDSTGPILLRTSLSGTNALIEVTDRGQGIAEGELESIFLPFYRTDSSRTKETGGSGLGLSLAQRIMRAHGGELSAQSTLGTGSTFIMTLPLQTPS